jgi:hypothetical protein
MRVTGKGFAAALVLVLANTKSEKLLNGADVSEVLVALVRPILPHGWEASERLPTTKVGAVGSVTPSLEPIGSVTVPLKLLGCAPSGVMVYERTLLTRTKSLPATF